MSNLQLSQQIACVYTIKLKKNTLDGNNHTHTYIYREYSRQKERQLTRQPSSQSARQLREIGKKLQKKKEA